MTNGPIIRSKQFRGDDGNARRPASFDLQDGYLGISQVVGRTVVDRVLLSPSQVRALLAFVNNTQRENGETK